MYFRILFITLAVFLGTPWRTEAQTPYVVSFGASPTSANSGFPFGFSWDLENAGGYSFIIPCVQGIKMFDQSGTVFSCGSKNSSTTKTDDFINVVIHNVSGGTKSVTARIIPKDASGNDTDNAERTISISVATLAEPITSFTTSATTTSSGQAITISWVSQIISGVNLAFECRSGINVSSPSYTPGGFIPCGVPVFSSDLAKSGSLSLSFLNPSASAIPYRLTLLPAIESGSYDGAHAKYLDLIIASDILPDPSVTSFTASAKTVVSGGSAAFSWTTANAVGANLQIACNAFIHASSSGSATNLPCGESAFASPLGASGSLTLSFTNAGPLGQDILVKLLPSKKSGEYDATRAKEIVITVMPPPIPKETVASTSQTTVTTPPPPPAPQPAPTQTIQPVTPLAPTPAPKNTGGTTKPSPPSITKPSQTTPTETPETKEPETPSVPPASGLETIPLLKATPRQETAEDRIKNVLTKDEVVSYTTSIAVKQGSSDSGTGKIYEVIGKKQVSLFAFIPLYMEVKVEVTASGEIQKIKKPWWSFLAW